VDKTFDLIGHRRWYYALSLAVILPGLFALYTHHVRDHQALNWGVDFTGGNSIELQINDAFTTGDIRQLLQPFGLGDAVIQQSGQSNVFIRTRPLTQDQTNQIVAAVKHKFPKSEMLQEDTVGPEIGAELQNKAIMGVVIGLILQVIFISVRFRSIRFAIAADIALLHDLLVVIGAFAITRLEVDSSFLAVLLTVAGYSINDTIVIFDRIRENLNMRTREPFEHLVNRSVLEALVRSINTAMTAVLAIGAVYLFGGETIRPVAFGLMVSIITGGYSSIFNASPILVDWHNWAERRSGAAARAPRVVPAPQPALPSTDGAAGSDGSLAPVLNAPVRSGTGRRRRGGGRRRR
jgi:preprotein translocase subunit SecF